MFEQPILNDVKSAIDSSTSIIIAIPPDPDIDTVASALALFLSLSGTKPVQIGCSSSVKVNGAKIFGLEKIQNSIGSQNLVISLNYPETKLDKIDYEKTPEGNIKLFIKPLAGQDAPKPEMIKIGFAGANADLVIVLGILSLEELGKLYSDEKTFFDAANIISITTTSSPGVFAKHSLHTDKTGSIAEIVAYLFEKTSLSIVPEAAGNLLIPIVESTNNFASLKTSADTFEMTAFLLRNGGKRPSTIAPFSNFNTPKPFTPPGNVPPDWKSPKVFQTKPSFPNK